MCGRGKKSPVASRNVFGVVIFPFNNSSLTLIDSPVLHREGLCLGRLFALGSGAVGHPESGLMCPRCPRGSIQAPVARRAQAAWPKGQGAAQVTSDLNCSCHAKEAHDFPGSSAPHSHPWLRLNPPGLLRPARPEARGQAARQLWGRSCQQPEGEQPHWSPPPNQPPREAAGEEAKEEKSHLPARLRLGSNFILQGVG